MKKFGLGALAALALITTPLATTQAQDHPSKLPVEVFSDAPIVSDMTLSPNGEFIAFESLVNGKNFITIQDLSGESQQQVGTPKNMYVRSFRWANDDVLLVVFFMRSKGKNRGGERLYSFNRKTEKFKGIIKPDSQYVGQSNQYTPFFQSGFISMLPEDKDHILMSLAPIRGSGSSVYKLNVNSGSRSSLNAPMKKYRYRSYNKDGLPWFASGNRDVPANTFLTTKTPEEHKKLFLYRISSDGENWRSVSETEREFYSNARDIEQLDDGTQFAIGTYHGGTTGVYVYDPSGENYARQLDSAPFRDVSDPIWDTYTNSLIGFRAYNMFVPDHYIDQEYVAAQQFAFNSLKGVAIDIVDKAYNKPIYLLSVKNDRLFEFFFLLNMETKSIKPIAASRPAAKQSLMSPTREITVPSRDGLQIRAQLTVPLNAKESPLVVMPRFWSARLSRPASTMRQFLASRGYAVLEVAPRGARYTYEYQQAGIGEVTDKAGNDIIDATQWARNLSIINEDQVCLLGSQTSAGYHALLSYMKQPDIYNCAININGAVKAPFEKGGTFSIYNGLNGFIGSTHIYGHDDQKIENNSPLNNPDTFKDPVLLIGVEEQSFNNTLNGLKSFKNKVDSSTLITLKRTEFDSISNPEHRKKIYTEIEKFLKKNIK